MSNVNISMTGSGSVGDIAGWSVSEASTPVSIASREGSTGSVRVEAKARVDSKFIANNLATFEHEQLGDIHGIIGNPEVGGISAEFDIAPLVNLLNVERTMQPTGQQPLSSIFDLYVSMVTDQILVDYQASSDPVRLYGGWSGNVWDGLKALCAANHVEIAVSGLTMIVRDIGTTELVIDDSTLVVLSMSTDQTGRAIEVVYHNYELISEGALTYNYSQNPSVETNATGWSATKGTYGTITSGRVT